MTSTTHPPAAEPRLSLAARLRARFGRRAVGMVLALAVEALIVLLLVFLQPSPPERREPVAMSTFSLDAPPPAETDAEPEAPAPETAPPEPRPAEPVEAPAEAPPAPAQPAEAPPPPVVPPPPAAVRVAAPPPAAPPAPARPRRIYGPPGSAAPAAARDSEVVGRAPNGQPMYAAAWHREPYPEELRGYLSTARGPGYGLIACRTVPGYRVEDCVGLDEWPQGSQITRAVLAAAWQFRVRPPRVGGELKFGEWVRIRIDYSREPAPRPGRG